MNNSSDAYLVTGQNRFEPDEKRFNQRVELVINCIALFIAVIGNAFVIAAVKQKIRRSINDLFIVNLSISDLLFAAVMVIKGIFVELSSGSVSLLFCVAIRPLPTIAFCLSVLTMTSMAVVRCRIMCYPHTPKIRTVYCWIVILWLTSFFASLPIMLVAKVTPQGGCTGDWPSVKYKDAYIVGLLLLKCALPLIIITCTYVKIGIYLVQNKRSQTCLDEHRTLNYRNVARKENLQIVQVLAAIVLLFGICTSPHQVVWMLSQFGKEKEREIAAKIFSFSAILQSIHACVNSFIYTIMSKQFREDCLKSFAKLLDCAVVCHCCQNAVIDNQPIIELKYQNRLKSQRKKRSDEIAMNILSISDEKQSAEV